MDGDDARSEPRRGPRTPAGGSDRDEPVLPDVSRDETAEGWGDSGEGRDERWYREQRPPHWE